MVVEMVAAAAVVVLAAVAAVLAPAAVAAVLAPAAVVLAPVAVVPVPVVVVPVPVVVVPVPVAVALGQVARVQVARVQVAQAPAQQAPAFWIIPALAEPRHNPAHLKASYIDTIPASCSLEAGISFCHTSLFSEDTVDLWFEGISRPVRLSDNATDLLPLMREITGTWVFDEKPDEHPDPVITIWGHDNGYSRTSGWLDGPKSYPDPVNAVCDFIVDLTHAFNADHPDVLCLHCAATIIGGQLVVFPNGYNQGKSTFMTLLASRGIRILCDDVMPLDLTTFKGQALGIQPRLRVPVPTTLGPDFDAFVRDHAGPSSARFHYLKLGADMLASFGESFPIGGIVILERNTTDENTITAAGQADTLKAIILRNFADSMPAANILDGLFSLIDQARLFRLNYAQGDQAVRLLLETFGTQPEATTQ